MVFTKLLDFDFENTVGITKTVSADVNNTVRLITKNIFTAEGTPRFTTKQFDFEVAHTHTHYTV